MKVGRNGDLVPTQPTSLHTGNKHWRWLPHLHVLPSTYTSDLDVSTSFLQHFTKMSETKQDPSINILEDAKQVFAVLQNGGLAIIPVDVGYAIIAGDTVALERAFQTKQRKPHKRHAMIGSYALHKEIHTLPPRQAGMAKLLVHDLNLPLGLVAPFKPDHPMIQRLGQETLARSSIEGTLAMLVNGGQLMDELARLALDAEIPIMGSSANLTGQGTKCLVEEIEPQILEAADIVINYGRQKYNTPRTSSTMYDFANMKLLRYGACYDVIKDAFQRFYGVELPEDPGKDVLFSGHAVESMNKY
jgi:tRNA A37 threonylcarbamoyladenosine synthetase subunit TsaC/SUA5/YrdC